MLLKMNISFLFADNEHQMHFFFNVSYVGQFEKILQAEFHLFKLKPRIPPGMTLPRNVHLIEVWNMYHGQDTRVYGPIQSDPFYATSGTISFT